MSDSANEIIEKKCLELIQTCLVRLNKKNIPCYDLEYQFKIINILIQQREKIRQREIAEQLAIIPPEMKDQIFTGNLEVKQNDLVNLPPIIIAEESVKEDFSITQTVKELLTDIIWKVTSIVDRPDVTLTEWFVYEIDIGDKSSRHFIGYSKDQKQCRVSSPIIEFDPTTKTGKTRSGNVYQLEGPSTTHEDVEYMWSRWCAKNKITKYMPVLLDEPNLDIDVIL